MVENIYYFSNNTYVYILNYIQIYTDIYFTFKNNEFTINCPFTVFSYIFCIRSHVSICLKHSILQWAIICCKYIKISKHSYDVMNKMLYKSHIQYHIL